MSSGEQTAHAKLRGREQHKSLTPLGPHCLHLPPALSVLTSSAGRKEAEVGIQPHSSQMRRNCLQGKKKKKH